MTRKKSPHDLEDRDYLRTMSTAHLHKLRDTTERSTRELAAYFQAICDVLDEREEKQTGG